MDTNTYAASKICIITACILIGNVISMLLQFYFIWLSSLLMIFVVSLDFKQLFKWNAVENDSGVINQRLLVNRANQKKKIRRNSRTGSPTMISSTRDSQRKIYYYSLFPYKSWENSR